MDGTVCTGQLDVFSISQKKHLRASGTRGDITTLGRDEFFTFSLYIKNTTLQTFRWTEARVQVDGGPPCRWGAGQIAALRTIRLHMSHAQMQICCTPGTHTAVWYLDGKQVHQEQFVLCQSMNWQEVFSFPSTAQISQYDKQSTRRSPYLTGWFHIPAQTRYTEYQVDFRVGHLPKGSYYSLGNFSMDHSALERKYASVRTEYSGVNGYAGFQRIDDGRTVSIMSFWDVYCKTRSGNETTIRAKRLYPATVLGGGEFTGEGNGARSTAPFPWEANHWYRMILKAIPGRQTTLVEQWVQDLETEQTSLLCRFDLGVPDSAFKGSIAIFLENYIPATSGQIRSMEVRNAQYRDRDTQKWVPLTQVHLSSRAGIPEYEGSYNFGVTDNRIWMITSGVGGDWFTNGKGKPANWYTLNQT